MQLVVTTVAVVLAAVVAKNIVDPGRMPTVATNRLRTESQWSDAIAATMRLPTTADFARFGCCAKKKKMKLSSRSRRATRTQTRTATFAQDARIT
jgi:H+/gluconate symporter-like permease